MENDKKAGIKLFFTLTSFLLQKIMFHPTKQNDHFKILLKKG